MFIFWVCVVYSNNWFWSSNLWSLEYDILGKEWHPTLIFYALGIVELVPHGVMTWHNEPNALSDDHKGEQPPVNHAPKLHGNCMHSFLLSFILLSCPSFLLYLPFPSCSLFLPVYVYSYIHSRNEHSCKSRWRANMREKISVYSEISFWL